MNPFSAGTRLRDMIRAIRSCKTAAEERAVVRKECADIRTAINDNDQEYQHRNLAKLMFIHMLGYPTHFAQMECLKLIASSGFPEKRIGYLGLMLILDERQEVLMLVTNSLKQDLNHSNQYIVGLALCALGNICSAEMARDLAPEVERLLQFRDPNIRKKATLCSIRIIKKVPDLAENFLNPAAALLKEKHHGVLISGIQLCTDLCKVSHDARKYFKAKCMESLVKTLKDLVNSPYAPEYDISGVLDPFLHIRLLQLMGVIGQGDTAASDFMNDMLAQVATKTESNKNAGNAILYECVATILSIEDVSGLRVLAINILGRFLSNHDNNIRFVALNMLMKAVTIDPQAVQRHQATILECVKDLDASIRKRALELVHVLVNESNIKTITMELIEYLEVSDQEFKGELTAKICSIVEKFSDKMWYIDQMVKVLIEAGNFVKDEVWHLLIVIITNASGMHGYIVRSLYRALQTSVEQKILVRVSVWCIGEFGDLLVSNARLLDVEKPLTVTDSDVVDVIVKALKCHASDISSSAMVLIALLKLSSHLPSCSERINGIFIQYKSDVLLELQQRSVEFNSIIAKHSNIRSALVERMPILDEKALCGRRQGTLHSAVKSSTTISLPNGTAKPSHAPLLDLLDLSDVGPSPSSCGPSSPQDFDVYSLSSFGRSGISKAPTTATDMLLDLLSVGVPPAQNSSSTQNLSISDGKSQIATSDMPTLNSIRTQLVSVQSDHITDLINVFSPSTSKPDQKGPIYPSIIAFESNTLRITFNFSKQPENPRTTFILATFTNLSPHDFVDFNFQAAVPKFLQLQLDPASSSKLFSNNFVTQNLRVTNTQHGKKCLAMRIRAAYKISNDKDVMEEGQINNFPRDL